MARKEKNIITKTPMEKAESQIKTCVALSYILAIITVIFSVRALTASPPVEVIAPNGAVFSLVQGVLIGALGFGVSKKSRICAIALPIIFCLDKIMQLNSGVPIDSMILSILIWGYAYGCGILGTFAYKRLKAEEALWLADTDA